MIGNKKIWQFFQKTLQSKRLAQAYIFWGPENLGKKLFALNLAKALVGNEKLEGAHPDIHILEPGPEIKIDQVRKLQHQFSLSTYQSAYKIAIIDKAESFTQEAANALLKTLEEPTGQAIIILISAWPEMILPTIISRCQKIRFSLVSEDELIDGLKKLYPKISLEKIKEIAKLSGGRPGLAIKFLEDEKLLNLRQKSPDDLEKLSKASFKERFDYAEWLVKDIALANFILDSWLIYFRDLLLISLGKPELTVYQNKFLEVQPPRIRALIKKTTQTKLLLSNPSFNTKLILENLLMEL